MIRWSSDAAHYAIAERVRETLAHWRELRDVIALLGMEELGAQDRLIVTRARRLQRFLTQPFTVTEAFTGIAGPIGEARRYARRLSRHSRWRGGRMAGERALHDRRH